MYSTHSKPIKDNDYFHDVGRTALDNGYLIIPIKPGEKRPAIANWQNARMTTANLDKYPDCGVGILTGQGQCPIVGLDIDISHAAINEAVIAWCQINIGYAPARVGAAPRVMLVYRAAEAGWAKRDSTTFFDPDDPVKLSGKPNLQQIEVLGNGQQFLAYAIHPDTHKPYHWVDLFGGLEHVTAADLTFVTEDQIEELFEELSRLVTAHGFELSGSASNNAQTLDDDDDDDNALMGMAAKVGMTIAQAAEALAALDKDICDNYNKWVNTGMAIHHEFDGSAEALRVWDKWSQRSAKYVKGEADRKWRTFSDEGRSLVTMHWVLSLIPILPKGLAQLAYIGLIDWTDAGNVNMLYRLTAGNLRFVSESNCFMHWDGKAWTLDKNRVIAQREILRVADHYLREAKGLQKQSDAEEKATEVDDKTDEGKALKKARKDRTDKINSVDGYGRLCRCRKAIDAMFALASHDARFAISAALLDRDPLLFGVANGVVDLRTGQLREAARDDFVTKRSKYSFKGAPCNRWRSFITDITGYPAPGRTGTPRPELARYLQKAIGYSITGLTAQHKMFIAVGAGGNGKNVLLDTVQEIAGEYWRSIQPEALMATRHDADAERPSPTTASLAGARAAISSESRDGQRLDVALLKRHTGGGFMTGRLMRENTLTFEITHKLWLMTNHLPSLDHLDDAMRGRLHLIPFDRQWNRPGHTERNPELPDGDKDLMATLKGEAEGILAWLVEGAVMYSNEGLEPPPEVTRMTRAYFDDADVLSQWLKQYETCDVNNGQLTSELYKEFRKCHGYRDDRSEKSFSDSLLARGFVKRRKSAGVNFGLRLKTEFADLF